MSLVYGIPSKNAEMPAGKALGADEKNNACHVMTSTGIIFNLSLLLHVLSGLQLFKDALFPKVGQPEGCQY